jgi:hypothetical protein
MKPKPPTALRPNPVVPSKRVKLLPKIACPPPENEDK